MSGGVYAQDTLLVPDSQIRVCSEPDINLIGSNLWIVDRGSRYGVKTTLSQQDVVSVAHEVWRWDEYVMTYPTSLFDLQLEQAGEYLIKTLINTNDGCTYVSEFPLAIFERLIVVIGPPLDEVALLSSAIDSETTLIKEILTDELTEQISKQLVDTATEIIIDAEALPVYLDTIGDTVGVERLYVVSDLDRATYRKLLATHSSLTSFNEIVVIEHDAVGSFFTDLLLRPEEETSITKRQVFQPGEGDVWGRWILGWVVEFALSQGVSLQIVRFFLLIPLLALLMTILRQVVWFTTYSIWYPLIIAWCGTMIWWVETFALVIAGGASVLLVSWLTRKLYLLSWAKTALIWALYAVICMVWYMLVVQQEWFGLGMIDQSMLLYTIMILYVCMSVFRSPLLMLKKKRWVWIIQFTLVTLVVRYCLQNQQLFDLMLAYPDSIWLVLVGIVVIGRFTGLQLTEYVRFMPLIGYLLSEEEEE